MKECLMVGVDVSKSWLDIYFKPVGTGIKISNDVRGFKQWFNTLKTLIDDLKGVLVIMEHTGQYSCRFEAFLRSKSIDYCKLAAIEIKRSMGMIRGKNDQIDAERIADYGWLRRDILQADQYPSEPIRELQGLISLRQKLVRDRSGYINRLKEMRAAGTCRLSDPEGQMQQQVVDFFTKKIAILENKIKALIAAHKVLQKTLDLLRTIKGIGLITATYMISCTHNFRRFGNARKFNCYAGIAPFKHQSGSSIHGKSRVSHLANKDVKTLLNLAASSAIRSDLEMKTYYEKRVAEGKNKMSCLNIIRAKLVARMFAVIKRQTPYQPLTIAAA